MQNRNKIDRSIFGARHVALGLTTVAVVGSLMFSGTVTEASAEELDSGVLSAISSAAPEVLQDVAQISWDSTAEAALGNTVADVTIVIPNEPTEGIAFSGPTSNSTAQDLKYSGMVIGLPFASEALPAEPAFDGAVSYDNGNESSTVPIVKTDGSLQITTILRSVEAPTSYIYPIDLPTDGSLELTDNGGAIVFDVDHEVTAYIAPAWARDASGATVPTHYEVDGNALIQVIAPSIDSLYPIVADPQFAWFGPLPSMKMNKAETASARDLRGAAAICGGIGKYLGWGAVALCGVSVLQIAAKSTINVWTGHCTQLVPAPGLILAVSYSGGYCR
ncbi:hypothetical protein [Cryobacterium sp. PH31-L1]|uniref:hypothetical protein n=1 Tax=Cryobacterium sp. PH31-L1 TaxID=3046199 RepID=UPI0024BA9B0B|nr:hypothetical protein [Cryobacterium sp. PH31-L1]MDJ0378630.1 hypothetical protein [Cryobacterium sp. PH31-L1]